MTTPSRRVALAIDALRHGWPVAIDGGPALLPAETGFAPYLCATRMLISGARAAGLRLANQAEAAEPDHPVLIRAAVVGGEIRGPAVGRGGTGGRLE